MSKNILQLKYDELREFLLKNESYCNFDLPPYFNFEAILAQLSKEMRLKNYHKYKVNKKANPSLLDDINYRIISNKNGKYDWRPLELINPILYVSLVEELSNYKNWKEIKKRFGKFYSKSKNVVQCISLPIVSDTKNSDKAEQITYWWEGIEQKSIELSLEYEYVFHTDISNCYSSIYTHSIQWAIHTKELAKSSEFRNSKSNEIGKSIDNHLQSMSYGQTNGIPQGSVMMDFIAEIVLHYADYLLSVKLNSLGLTDYKILRYRDDYRIFCNSTQTAHTVLKELTIVLSELGLKIHPGKTEQSDNVILGSIKKDKSDWLLLNKSAKTFQKKLLILHRFSVSHPNSGTVTTELSHLLRQLKKKPIQKRIRKYENIGVLISIIIDISFISPKVYSVSMALVSVLLRFLDDDQRLDIIKKIDAKFGRLPNIGFIQIWLQRALIKYDVIDFNCEEKLTKLVIGEDVKIWNTEWVTPKLQKIIKDNPIVKKHTIESLDFEIDFDEVSLFSYS